MTEFDVIGTKLCDTSYRDLAEYLFVRVKEDGCIAVDFTNVHIVTMRRSDPEFKELTSKMDYFVPDSMPLTWCVRAKGGAMRDRVYGPSFLREAIIRTPPSIRHYFLGANQECLEQLLVNVRKLNPEINIAGSHNGYFSADEAPAITKEINACDPDMIWVGLGTPKQQEWICQWKKSFSHGALLAVGFAFDVNAGTKKDAPMWMQRRGLTWIYRLCSEPRRLWWRYLKYNTLFLWYLFFCRRREGSLKKGS